MRRKRVMVLTIAAIGAAVAASAGALLAGNEPPVVPERIEKRNVMVLPSAGAEPDTTSSNWKFLSDDVGMMIRRDERLGLRARLYVRVGGVWTPVATDTAGDLAGPIPVK